MNVWLIHPGELLPIDGKVRLNRYGLLAEMMSAQGHEVTIWAPTFVHTTKKYRCTAEKSIAVNPRYKIELLHAPGYQRHISWQRYRFHVRLSDRFRERAAQQPTPDVILSGIPAPELCQAATQSGAMHQVPVLIDVRDLWPDAAFDYLPSWSRPAARLFAAPLVARNEKIFRAATGVIGVSQGFLDWGLRHAGRKEGPNDAVFPLGYPVTTYGEPEKNEARARWATWNVKPDGKFRCFFMASIGSLYDLETIIAAARELKQRRVENVQFVLCGDGPKLERLRTLADGLDNVVLPGWAKAVDAQVLLEMSDIGVIPYRAAVHTALPNKAVACFSAGLPVISNQGGEFASILEKYQCGVTYRAENAADFLRAFETVRRDDVLRSELSDNALRFFKNELNAERVYQRMIDFLGQIASRSVCQAA